MLSSFKGSVCLSALCTSVFFALVPGAVAQESDDFDLAAIDGSGVEEIIVSGEKIDRTLQETVSSVAVFDAKKIDQQNFIDLFDLINQTANVSSGFDDSVFTIRGVRNTGAGLGDTTSDVSTIYVDGVFLPSSLFQNGALNLWDVQSVEIFRGPQSTIQGRNALAGAIVARTVDPGNEWEGRGQISYAENNTLRVSGALTAPLLKDQISLRLAADYARTDGFITNTFLGTDKSDEAATTTARAKLLITPSAVPDLTIRFGYTYIDDFEGEGRVDEALFPDRRETRENLQSRTDTRADLFSLELDYTLSDSLSVTAVSGYLDNQALFLTDTTRDETGGQSAGNFNNTDRVISQEVRLTYETDRLAAVFGGYYFDSKGRELNNSETFQQSGFVFPDPTTLAGLLFMTPTPDAQQIGQAAAIREQIVSLVPEFQVDFDRDNPTDIRNLALFGEATYDVTDQLSVTLGARYDNEKLEQSLFDATIVPPFPPTGSPLIDGVLAAAAAQFTNAVNVDDIENTFSAFLPKGVVTYNWTDDLSTSFSVQRAYRAGGLSVNVFRAALPLPDGGDRNDQAVLERAGIVNSFDPEFTWNYELALRSQWFDNRLTVNANAFYIEYSDQQVQVQLSSNPLDRLTDNVGQSRLYGFEIEAFAQPIEGLDLNANVGFTDTKFTEGGVLDDVIGGGVDLTGNDFSFAPRWTAGVGARYTHDSGVFGNVRLRYQSKAFALADNNPTAVNSDFIVADVILGYATDRYGLELFVTNVTDSDYVTFDPQNPSQGALAVVGDPRVLGGRITANF